MDKGTECADKSYAQDEMDAVSDCPELTDEQIATARSFAEVFPEFIRKTPAAGMGRPSGNKIR